EPLLETPDIFEPDPEDELKEDELEFEPQAPPRMHSPLARALAVAVDVEAACQADDNGEENDNTETQVASLSAPAQMAPLAPKQTRPPQLGPVAPEVEEEPPFDAP